MIKKERKIISIVNFVFAGIGLFYGAYMMVQVIISMKQVGAAYGLTFMQEFGYVLDGCLTYYFFAVICGTLGYMFMEKKPKSVLFGNPSDEEMISLDVSEDNTSKEDTVEEESTKKASKETVVEEKPQRTSAKKKAVKEPTKETVEKKPRKSSTKTADTAKASSKTTKTTAKPTEKPVEKNNNKKIENN